MEFKGLKEEDIKSLYPLKKYYMIRHLKDYCKIGTKKKSLRKIFYNVKYDSFEEECLSSLLNYINEYEDLKYTNRELLLLILYTSKFDNKVAYNNWVKYWKFFNNIENFTISDEFEKIANLGVFYTYGKDKKFRPIIYFNCRIIYNNLDRVELISHYFKIFLNIIKHKCFEKYHVENWIMMIDTDNLGVSQFPYRAIQKCIVENSFFFSGCLHKLFVLNPCFNFNMGYFIIKNFIEENTRKYISLLNKSKFKVLLEDIDKDQLLEKYDGILKEPVKFWPPSSSIDRADKTPFNSMQEINDN